MPDQKPIGAQFERWVSVGGSIIAPATLLSALLFYFGYVSSRAQYDYFGIDVDTVSLSTQDYIMRSPQPLLVPLLILTLSGAAVLALHTRVRRHSLHPQFRRKVRRAILVGLVVLGIGLLLLFVYPVLLRWVYYPLVTPLVLALGGAITGYGLSTLRFLDARVDTAARAPQPPHLGIIVLVWAAVASCLFWATATIAEWSGLGLAQEQARNLEELPSVIVDTQERLFLPSEMRVSEMPLPAAQGQAFRYRYWGLRLLIFGDNLMFLVPNTWDSRDNTLVLPFDSSTRIQFQFRNLSPWE
ncbi:MAG: hypothetical protein H0V49_04285 [Nocardioidaceae bacterium]|nr:hypothetical protein [Nocardioidaceae bacterium]